MEIDWRKLDRLYINEHATHNHYCIRSQTVVAVKSSDVREKHAHTHTKCKTQRGSRQTTTGIRAMEYVDPLPQESKFKTLLTSPKYPNMSSIKYASCVSRKEKKKESVHLVTSCLCKPSASIALSLGSMSKLGRVSLGTYAQTTSISTVQINAVTYDLTLKMLINCTVDAIVIKYTTSESGCDVTPENIARNKVIMMYVPVNTAAPKKEKTAYQ